MGPSKWPWELYTKVECMTDDALSQAGLPQIDMHPERYAHIRQGSSHTLNSVRLS